MACFTSSFPAHGGKRMIVVMDGRLFIAAVDARAHMFLKRKPTTRAQLTPGPHAGSLRGGQGLASAVSACGTRNVGPQQVGPARMAMNGLLSNSPAPLGPRGASSCPSASTFAGPWRGTRSSADPGSGRRRPPSRGEGPPARLGEASTSLNDLGAIPDAAPEAVTSSCWPATSAAYPS